MEGIERWDGLCAQQVRVLSISEPLRRLAVCFDHTACIYEGVRSTVGAEIQWVPSVSVTLPTGLEFRSAALSHAGDALVALCGALSEPSTCLAVFCSISGSLLIRREPDVSVQRSRNTVVAVNGWNVELFEFHPTFRRLVARRRLADASQPALGGDRLQVSGVCTVDRFVIGLVGAGLCCWDLEGGCRPIHHELPNTPFAVTLVPPASNPRSEIDSRAPVHEVAGHDSSAATVAPETEVDTVYPSFIVVAVEGSDLHFYLLRPEAVRHLLTWRDVCEADDKVSFVAIDGMSTGFVLSARRMAVISIDSAQVLAIAQIASPPLITCSNGSSLAYAAEDGVHILRLDDTRT